MSEQTDLLYPKVPAVYEARVVTNLGMYLSLDQNHIHHVNIDFNRYLSSLFLKHTDGYRYVELNDVKVEQRCDDLNVAFKLALYVEHSENGFVVITSHATDVKVAYATQPFPITRRVVDAFIETITVDGKHVLSTDKVPATPVEVKSAVKITRLVAESIDKHGLTAKYLFEVPEGAGQFTAMLNGAKAELDNTVTFLRLSDDRAIEMPVSLTVLQVNGNFNINDVKVISPKVMKKDDKGEWVDTREDFFCRIDAVEIDWGPVEAVAADESYMLHPFYYSPGMNHHPAHPGIWVPYNNWRLKDRYDIQLHDGSRWKYYYPNGGSFTKWGNGDVVDDGGPQRVEDHEIAMVRLVPDDEIHEKYHFSGQERIDRNVRMFGDALPEPIVHKNGEVEFKLRYRRVFMDEQICADASSGGGIFGTGTNVLRYGEHTLTEILHLPFKLDDPLYISAVRYLKVQLEGKLYGGLSLFVHEEHGYVGTLNGENFADEEIDWVVRKLIDHAKTLPEKPVVQAALPDPFRTGKGLSTKILAAPRGFNFPKETKASKKAAKKARTRLRKAGDL